ncbi:MAG: hypothetical protein KJZ80_12430 [Hyphomicrobiaceae bacterium]|nr:hypothetical protein [Hyphomicrobiaceae bacterium]
MGPEDALPPGHLPHTEAPGTGRRPALQRLAALYPWHLCFFLASNVVVNALNAVTGGPWWAFWPSAATGLLLAAHHLALRAAAVDERWADRRAEELNLKSYDRSHIENLRSRYGGDGPARAPDR